MSWRDQDSADEPWQVSPRNSDASPRRPGIRIGQLPLTPTRLTPVIALIGSILFLPYAITGSNPVGGTTFALGRIVRPDTRSGHSRQSPEVSGYLSRTRSGQVDSCRGLFRLAVAVLTVALISGACAQSAPSPSASGNEAA